MSWRTRYRKRGGAGQTRIWRGVSARRRHLGDFAPADFLDIAFLADSRFAFPASVEPPVLARRFAHELFEMIGVPLRKQRHGTVFEGRIARIANRSRADFVV